MEIVNWKIVGHPLNWITLFLMVFIASIAVHFILSHVTGKPIVQSAGNQ